MDRKVYSLGRTHEMIITVNSAIEAITAIRGGAGAKNGSITAETEFNFDAIAKLEPV